MKFVGKSVVLEESGERVLIIGDLHIGYEQGIHQAGVATSFISDTCAELETLFNDVGKVQRVILLGDVIHRFAKAGNDEWRGVRAVFGILQKHCTTIIVVRGNHDVSLAPLLTEFNATLVDSWTWKGYCCVHGDRDLSEVHRTEVHTWLVGHGHPAFRLRDGAKSELYKCFLEGEYKGKQVILVPSFFSGVIGTDIGKYELSYPWTFDLSQFKVYLVEEKDVLLFGTVETLLQS